MRSRTPAPQHRGLGRMLLVVVALVVLLCGTAGAFPRVCDASVIAVKLAPGTLIQQTRDGGLAVVRDWDSLARRADDAEGLPLALVAPAGGLGITLLESSEGARAIGGGPESAEILRELRLLPGVLWAETGAPLQACRTPNDPYFPPIGRAAGEWGLVRTKFPQAWDMAQGSASVTVAFLDTGLNRDIKDLSDRIVSPYSVVAESSDWPAWRDNDGHGSAVTAVAVAQGDDGQGIAGAAWNVRIMPVKISEDGNSDTVTLASAIEYAVDQGADVLNISFATLPGVDPGEALRDAVAYAVNRGVVVVAAAGNDGGAVSYPAAVNGVISVGATTEEDTRWIDSGKGSNLGAGLDVVAPGSGILSYYPKTADKVTYVWSGTSLACPFVTGLAALMLSLNSSLTPAATRDIICVTAQDLGLSSWDVEYGYGLVDAEAALAMTAAWNPTVNVDPDATTPYASQIEYLRERGVVSGMGDGRFHPNEPLTRQQFAKMIVLGLGYPVSQADTCPFVDVPKFPGELYPYNYVAVTYTQGITSGTSSGHFSPYRTLTRAQLITMVSRAKNLPEPPSGYTTAFANFSAVHYPFARKAEYAGLLSGLLGMGPDFNFRLPATRGEACELLYSLLE